MNVLVCDRSRGPTGINITVNHSPLIYSGLPTDGSDLTCGSVWFFVCLLSLGRTTGQAGGTWLSGSVNVESP